MALPKTQRPRYSHPKAMPNNQAACYSPSSSLTIIATLQRRQEEWSKLGERPMFSTHTRKKKAERTSLFTIIMVATTTKTMSTWSRKKKKAMEQARLSRVTAKAQVRFYSKVSLNLQGQASEWE